jgi:hypothetical protein
MAAVTAAVRAAAVRAAAEVRGRGARGRAEAEVAVGVPGKLRLRQ